MKKQVVKQDVETKDLISMIADQQMLNVALVEGMNVALVEGMNE